MTRRALDPLAFRHAASMPFRVLGLALALLAVAGTPPAVAQTPPALVSVEAAFMRAATAVFDQVAPDALGVTVVIDPLVDGVTGIQSEATRDFDRRIAELVAERYRHVTVLPFTPENAATATYVFIGTFNTINNAGQPAGPRDAYWICFALVDREAKTVFARATTRATLVLRPVAPVATYADAPVWALDTATAAYIEACQRSQPGTPVAPAYLDQLPAAARIREAAAAYEGGDYKSALGLYRDAEAMPGGDQLRVLNGLYLAHKALGETAQADVTFSRLVDAGLALGKLGVIFLFEAGTTDFEDDVRVSTDYPDWLQAVASRAREKNACLEITGHASRTGPDAVNDPLSLRRAERIVALMQAAEPEIARHIKAAGVGARQVLVGLQRDDASTAIDRRVEFKPVPCSA